MSPLSAAEIGLPPVESTAELAEASTAAVGAVPVDNPRVRAADAVIGFPQSMQKRDEASFSRPQNEQVASELTVGWGGTCGANIGQRRGLRENNERGFGYRSPLNRSHAPRTDLDLAHASPARPRSPVSYTHLTLPTKA